MIKDNETNLLYLSDQLALRQSFFNELRFILNRNKIQYKILPNTKDIWCVDYMPIQKTTDSFIQFTYQPDYLQNKKYISTQTDTSLVCTAINIETERSNIKIDGGNVIRGKDWVVLTDKIFKENKTFSKQSLLKELEIIFEAKPIIIPREPGDYTGHADGMVRYYDERTLLINSVKPNDKRIFHSKLIQSLIKEGFSLIEIPNAMYDNDDYDSADGLYINYLQMKNFLLIPTFNKKEDEFTIKKFQELFPRHVIETIDAKEISKDGGVLNCITWNIKVN